jgi:hypothetical protein
MNIPDYISESLETIVWVKITWILWGGPGIFWPWIRDGKIQIRDAGCTCIL